MIDGCREYSVKQKRKKLLKIRNKVTSLFDKFKLTIIKKWTVGGSLHTFHPLYCSIHLEEKNMWLQPAADVIVSLRQVTKHIDDKVIPDTEVSQSLLQLFRALLKTDIERNQAALSLLPHSARAHYFTEELTHRGRPVDEHDAMFQTMGFGIQRRPSSLPSAGIGVFITAGFVQKGTIVAMYPGTVYQPFEPIFFQSIRNPFVFRCIDGVFIDGNDKVMSKMVYKSCSGRDQIGPFKLSDVSWLTSSPRNPLAVGQYVNNCFDEMSANVCYQEYDVPDDFPLELRQYLPNVKYSNSDSQRPLRCVVLVSLRSITSGEELFSNYYTIVH